MVKIELDDEVAAALELLIEALHTQRKRENDARSRQIQIEKETKYMEEIIDDNSQVKGSQRDELLKFIKSRAPHVVYPRDIQAWLVNNGWSPTSVSEVAQLKPLVICLGRKKGYKYVGH
jgi:hypothetical protein